MLHDIKVKKMNIRGFFIAFLLLGTAIRIPVSSSATISFAEIILVISLVCIPLYFKTRSIKLSEFKIMLPLLVFIVLSLLFVECIINFHRIVSILLIFEYLFIGILLMFLFKGIAFEHNVYYKSLVLFSFYLSINSIYYNIIRYEQGNIVSVLKFGSGNYTSAVMLLMIPIMYLYIRENINSRLNLVAYFSIFFMIISIIFSGSRSNIVVVLFQIGVYIFFVKNSISKRIKIIFSIIFIGVIGYNIVLLINPELSYIIERYLVFFTGNLSDRNDILYSDILRKQLITEAKAIISENKLWGTGFARLPYSDTPIHNFVYEIILAIGYVGFTVYVIYFFKFVGGILRNITNHNSERLICLVMIITFLLISWVHPFMTTGKEFTFIFWLSLIAFSTYSYNKSSSE